MVIRLAYHVVCFYAHNLQTDVFIFHTEEKLETLMYVHLFQLISVHVHCQEFRLCSYKVCKFGFMFIRPCICIF